MSKDEKDGLMDCLFSRQGRKLRNIKFFRGSSDVISEEQFRKELLAAADRKQRGVVKPSTSAPKCKKGPVDLRAFVANI